MKGSIGGKITVVFTGLIVFILVVLVVVNSQYLENFYLMEKINSLEKVYEQLNEQVLLSLDRDKTLIEAFEESMPDSGLSEAALVLKEVSEKYSLTILVCDSITGETLLPSQWDSAFFENKMQRYLFGDSGLPDGEVFRETEHYTIQRTLDNRTKSLYLESWGYFSDGRTFFIITTPLASIQEGVIISNRFLAYAGFITLLISIMIVYLMTMQIIKPIKQLALLSERLSDLDFDARYEENATDEIGVLGSSMNVLADRLKDTISELKSVNCQLQMDIQEKIEVDEMRKEFIANVSHELKTPIALIQGYAEGLVEGMCQDDESRDYYCQVIVDESGRMNKMVSQLLSLTALEFGKDQVVIEPFDLFSLISGVVASMDIIIQQKNAKIILESNDVIPVWADEFKIEQVLMNYLNNALNHLDGAREIRITVEQGSLVKVTVENTGAKIPEEALPQIWTKFFKVDKARTREYGGSGIGLSIVKAIIDSHHRECGVYNTETGVAFWFTLNSKDPSAESL